MKRRRTLIISLLLVATLVLGIGYAATSTTLTWEGDVANDPLSISVIFTDATEAVTVMTSARQTTVADACNPGTTGSDTISPKVDGLKEVGDQVTFTYTVTNNSDVDVKLNAPAFDPTFTSEYFEVTIGSWTESRVAVGGTSEIDLTVRLIKVSDAEQSANFTITALAEPYNNTLTP